MRRSPEPGSVAALSISERSGPKNFEGWDVTFHDLIDVGGEDVLVLWADSGRGKVSGVLVERPRGAFLHTLSPGKIVRTVQYGSVDEALAAVGLRD